MKVYLKGDVLGLAENNSKRAEFQIGTGITTIGEKNGVKSPYTYFEDCDEKAMKLLADRALNTLYDAEDTSADLLMQLPIFAADTLNLGREWKMSLSSDDGEIVPAFTVHTTYDLMALELLLIIWQKKTIKKCSCCGKFFFPTGRKDALYCNRVGKDGYACKKIGANRKYRMQSRNDDVKTMYDKITKHNRYLKSAGLIDEDDFAQWMKEATTHLAQLKNGEISERVMIDWLSSDLVSTVRPVRRNEISDYLL